MHDMSANFAKKNQNYNKPNYRNNMPGNGNFGSNFGGDKTIVCQICYIPGHGAYKCKNRFNHAFVPKQGRGNQEGYRPRGGYGFGRNYRRGGGKGFNGGFPRGGNFQGYVAYQPPLNFQPSMPPSFIYPQSAVDFYNGYAPAAMYAGKIGFNPANISSGSVPNNFNSTPATTPLANYNVVANQAWYIDSGATNHITQNTGIFLNCSKYTRAEKLYIGNGLGLIIEHVGSSILRTQTTHNLQLTNILHVPTITKNLLSVFRLLTDNNVVIEFHKSICFVKDKSTGITLLKGIARDGLYQVEGLITVC